MCSLKKSTGYTGSLFASPAADSLVSQAYSTYKTYHGDPSPAHYTEFHDAAAQATAASSAFSGLITALGTVYNTDDTDLANAAALASNVVNYRGNVQDFDPVVRHTNALPLLI